MLVQGGERGGFIDTILSIDVMVGDDFIRKSETI